MRPARLENWLRAACAVALLWGGRAAAQAPDEAPPADPVDVLGQTLRAPAPALDARDAELAARVAVLHTLDHYRRALLLRDWRDLDPDEPAAAVDRRHRDAVVERFTHAARGVLARGELGERLDLLRRLGSLEVRGAGGAPLTRSLTTDVIELTRLNPPALREAAVRALGQIRPEAATAVPALAGLFQDADPVLRACAAEALARLVTQATATEPRDAGVAACRAVLPVAAYGLADSDAAVRGRCAEALGRSATVLGALVPPPVVPEDAEAAEAYARQVDEETAALLPLVAALKEQTGAVARATGDTDPRVRLLARQTLEDVAEARVRLIRRTSSVLPLRGGPALLDVQTRAMAFLQDDPLREGLVAALPALTAGLNDPDVRARRAAIDVLETLGRAAVPAVPALVKALSDRDRFVRWAAARALGKVRPTNPEQVVPHLAQLLSDADPNLRVAAATALNDYGPGARSALPDLLQAAQSGDGELRLAVVRALESIGSEDEAALAALGAALNDTDPRVRRVAGDVLGKVAPPSRAAADALLRESKTNGAKAVGSAAKKP